MRRAKPNRTAALSCSCIPSSIAAYGLPDLETRRKAGRVREDDWNKPITMYGCNKLYCEHLGRYYSKHYKQLLEARAPRVDFRCVRFPGLISAVTVPSGGTSDYASEMIHAAARGEPYACFVRPDTRIPFMAMPDAIDALLKLSIAQPNRLSCIGVQRARLQSVGRRDSRLGAARVSRREDHLSGRCQAAGHRRFVARGRRRHVGAPRLGLRAGVRLRPRVPRVPDPHDSSDLQMRGSDPFSIAMIAISIAKPGGPEVLQPVEMPVPRPGPREVLIRVAAAGVNRPDLMQREGKYPPPPGASDIPGLEVSGTIAACGPDVDALARRRSGVRARVGRRLRRILRRARRAVPADSVDGRSRVRRRRCPKRSSPSGRTSSSAGGFATGESFLVHGGASGIGTTAIQMARAFGARVFATAGTDEKCAACERLGAERAINYKTEDFAAALMPLTGGRGVDVILDMVGAPYFSRNLDLLALEGRLLQIAVLHGAKAEINLVRLLRQRLTITGSTLRVADGGREGRDCECGRAGRVAARRGGKNPAGRLRDVPAYSRLPKPIA